MPVDVTVPVRNLRDEQIGSVGLSTARNATKGSEISCEGSNHVVHHVIYVKNEPDVVVVEA